MSEGDFEWACFAMQQAAEKAVKVVYQSVHIDSISHSVSRMIQSLPNGFKPPQELVEHAKELKLEHRTLNRESTRAENSSARLSKATASP